MEKLFTIALIFLISQIGFGQKDSSIYNSLSFSTGLDHISLKDRTFSPIVFTGIAPKISIGYRQNRRENSLWHTTIEVSAGNVDHENESFSSTYISAQFSFGYLKNIKSNDRSNIYLGAQFRSVLNILDYDGFASGSWFTSQQLEPILMYTYTITERQSITGQISYPIINLVNRPGYAGNDEFVVMNSDNIPKILYSRTKLQSLGNVINPNVKLEYTYLLEKMCFSFSVNYSYLQVNSIRKYYKNEFGINLGIHLKIGSKNEK